MLCRVAWPQRAWRGRRSKASYPRSLSTRGGAYRSNQGRCPKSAEIPTGDGLPIRRQRLRRAAFQIRKSFPCAWAGSRRPIRLGQKDGARRVYIPAAPPDAALRAGSGRSILRNRPRSPPHPGCTPWRDRTSPARRELEIGHGPAEGRQAFPGFYGNQATQGFMDQGRLLLDPGKLPCFANQIVIQIERRPHAYQYRLLVPTGSEPLTHRSSGGGSNLRHRFARYRPDGRSLSRRRLASEEGSTCPQSDHRC